VQSAEVYELAALYAELLLEKKSETSFMQQRPQDLLLYVSSKYIVTLTAQFLASPTGRTSFGNVRSSRDQPQGARPKTYNLSIGYIALVGK
jgi:hypothetical protein